jgi:hypothetical protein
VALTGDTLHTRASPYKIYRRLSGVAAPSRAIISALLHLPLVLVLGFWHCRWKCCLALMHVTWYQCASCIVIIIVIVIVIVIVIIIVIIVIIVPHVFYFCDRGLAAGTAGV